MAARMSADVIALDGGYNHGYTSLPMKTAISIPDEVFEAAERAAKSLGVSRSELYATAVREYLERYRREDLTEKLNQVYGQDETASELARCARRTVARLRCAAAEAKRHTSRSAFRRPRRSQKGSKSRSE